MTEFLIRRDTPLPRGTVIELHVTSYYVVAVDDEILDADEHSITLDEIERRMSTEFASKRSQDIHNSRVVAAVERDYTRGDAEGTWMLPNPHSRDESRTFRFPDQYEQGYPWLRQEFVTLAEALAPEVDLDAEPRRSIA